MAISQREFEESEDWPHLGHRVRLHERFRGADALSDYELLEIVLLCRAATSSRSPNPRSRNSARSPRNRSAKYVVLIVGIVFAWPYGKIEISSRRH
jgi:hypothetical protein